MNKNMTQPICFRVEIPKEIFSLQLNSYFATLCELLHGFPSEISMGSQYCKQNIAMSCNVYFFSIECYSQFSQLYAKMLKGEFQRDIWEKANGIILDDTTKEYLIKFGEIFNQITPVIDFMNKNGGLLNDSFPGFDVLEKSVEEKTLPIKILNSYNFLTKMMCNYLMVCEQFQKLNSGKLNETELSKKGLSYKVNIKLSFIEFYKILEEFSPCIDFINTYGGWHNSQVINRAFIKMKKLHKSGNLPDEILISLKQIRDFLDIYLPISKYISENEKNVIMQVIPHSH